MKSQCPNRSDCEVRAHCVKRRQTCPLRETHRQGHRRSDNPTPVVPVVGGLAASQLVRGRELAVLEESELRARPVGCTGSDSPAARAGQHRLSAGILHVELLR